jgi:exodeoxyribonuclease-3
MGIPKHDDEGRVITVEFEKVFLVTVYTPNSQNELRRLDYRTKEWDADFRQYVKDLERTKPVLIGGDLNVAHKEIDLANPKTNTKNAGFTPEERESFDTLLNEGFVDTFRMFHEGGGHYTWWSYRARARERNVGWRIDYFCASKSLRPNIKRSEILNEITGSDHCPVLLEVDDLI